MMASADMDMGCYDMLDRSPHPLTGHLASFYVFTAWLRETKDHRFAHGAGQIPYSVKPTTWHLLIPFHI